MAGAFGGETGQIRPHLRSGRLRQWSGGRSLEIVGLDGVPILANRFAFRGGGIGLGYPQALRHQRKGAIFPAAFVEQGWLWENVAADAELAGELLPALGVIDLRAEIGHGKEQQKQEEDWHRLD